VSNITDRKADHIQLALAKEHQGIAISGFDRVQFEHNPIPEMALHDTNLSTEFLGHALNAPIIIGAMTGGCDNGDLINQHLAEAAEQSKVVLALGSQRAALELGLAQNVRRWAPKAVILGNLGATQLQQQGAELARRAVESVEANALVIHLNPLQELIQPKGDRDWNQVLDAIHQCCSTLSQPIIVKEVGSGIGPTSAKKLIDAGVSWIEVAGRGGTSWASIEMARNHSTHEQMIAQPFLDWGMDTVTLLPQLAKLSEEPYLIGSGGVRHGLDIARCIRLGAPMSALAQPFLKPALHSTEAVIETLSILSEQLRWTMFLTGCKNLQQLAKAPLCSNQDGCEKTTI
jgi:isopentenyl-diphosphate delta-isomerase